MIKPNNISKLKIALLKCDTFIPDIKNKYGDIDIQFKNLLNCNTRGVEIDWKVYEVANNEFPTKEECKNVIITGSRSSVNDNSEWINKLKEYIVYFSKNNVKTVGICFGHQAIATALGGTVGSNSKGWSVSDHKIDLIEESNLKQDNPTLYNNLFDNGNRKHLNIICSNKEIVNSVPLGFQVFCKNDRSPNQAMYFKNQFFSFQGHPEYTPNIIKSSLNARKGIIPDDTIADGFIRADNSKIDKSIYANSIIDFFTTNNNTTTTANGNGTPAYVNGNSTHS